MRPMNVAVRVLCGTAAGLLIVRAQEPGPAERSVSGRPVQISTDSYVSSETCRACHPSEYASWRASFHRTMTQLATPASVRASFDHAVVNDVPGNPIQLERRGRLRC